MDSRPWVFALVSNVPSASAAEATQPTQVTSTSGVQLLGVNLSGAEYGNPATGVLNYDYTYPTTSEIDYFASLKRYSYSSQLAAATTGAIWGPKQDAIGIFG
jgi:hypothetical protein